MARSVRIYKHAIVILSLIVGGIKKPDENTKRGWEKQEEKEIGRPSASSVCVCVAFGPKRFVYSLRELFLSSYLQTTAHAGTQRAPDAAPPAGSVAHVRQTNQTAHSGYPHCHRFGTSAQCAWSRRPVSDQQKTFFYSNFIAPPTVNEKGEL